MDKITAGDEVIIRRWPLVLGTLAAFLVFFYVLKPILAPFVLGALLAYFGDPLVDILERRRINRTLGVLLVFLLTTLILLAIVLVTVPLVASQLDALVDSVPRLYRWIDSTAVPWLRHTFNLSDDSLPALEWGRGQLAENWQSVGKWLAAAGKQVTGSGFGILLWLANLALVPVVAFYLMRDWDKLVGRGHDLIPRDWQEGVTEVVHEADEVVGAFLRGQLVVMVCLALYYGLGLWVVGVQLAVALGLIAGLASIVPYLGFFVGIGLSLLVAYSQSGDWSTLLGVAAVFGIGQLLESMFLTPILVGDRIGLHPVVVIFALMAGGQLAGFLGVLVALPVAAVIAVLIRHLLHYYQSSHYYAGSAGD